MRDGQVVLITGGASGIGRALGEALADRGARVVLADRQLDLAENVAADIRRNGRTAEAVALDVRDAAAFARVANDISARFGGIDMFFNNAGIAIGGPMENYELKDWNDVFDVNLAGVTNGIQAIYPLMIRQKRGHIINTASMAGLITNANLGSYAATKHAVVGLSKALRVEAKRHGVRVSVLCPGFVRTAILEGGEFGRMKVPGVPAEAVKAAVERIRPMDPATFAQKALRAIERNEPIIVLPSWYKALWLLERVSPRASLALWTAVYERSVREAERYAHEHEQKPAAQDTNGRSSLHAS